MRHNATVISADGEIVKLSYSTQLCSACSGLFCAKPAYVFNARNAGGIELRPSDRVECRVSTPRALGAALALLAALPLLFLCGFVALRLIAPQLPQALPVAAGIVVVLAGGVAWCRRERPESYSDMPTVVRKLPASGSSIVS